MRIFVPAFLASIVLLLSSCQQEPDVILDDVDPPVDTVAHITSMFKIVVEYSSGQDSTTRIIKRGVSNGQKTVVIAEVYSEDPADTLFTVFFYDNQNRLTSIKSGPASNLNEVKYQLTWNGNQLTKVVADTLGLFAESYDFSYVNSGGNVIITRTKTPSDDTFGPDYISTMKYSATFDAQFVFKGEQFIGYSHVIPTNEIRRDTSNYFYTYSSGDLTSSVGYAVTRDTNVSGIPFLFRHDTLSFTYNRAAGSTNIADSLKQIYGPQLYAILNSRLFDFYYLSSVVTYNEQGLFFLNRPLSSAFTSRRGSLNGLPNPADDYTNMPWRKMDNTFDANGRLAKAVVYFDDSETSVDEIVRIYY